ncbi:MAG TPA: energy transducer TonB, partial [Candidatus Dormibacteraeota bacterium]|nr:energy transducer TonB [Candidatus Dormibacteraeota bacterium]
ERDVPLNRFGSLGSSGQATGVARAPVRLPAGRPPQLDIAWGSFHQGIGSSLGVLFRKSPVPKKFTIEEFFKCCSVEGKMPSRAIVAAALWHIVFFLMPFPQFPSRAHHNPSFNNVQLSWSGPIDDLPLLDMQARKPMPKPTPRGEPENPLPTEGALAFHPRQHIFSEPVHPTHPRQTLVNSAALPEPPKILPSLPNIVKIQELSGPERPRLQISKEDLAKLHPKQRRVAAVTDAPPPDVPVFGQKPGDLAMIAAANGPARPKLELNAGARPRIAPKAQVGDAGRAPEVGLTQIAGMNGNPATFIALSATPAPPAPVVPPQGNLAARVFISPEGKQPGVPGGSPKGTPNENGPAGGGSSGGGGAGAGNSGAINGIDISIRGGNPPANKGISGLAGTAKISAPSPDTLIKRPEPKTMPDDDAVRTGPPNFTALPAGARPEQIFASKKIYKMQIDMPNLNSATGSWILNFTELRIDPNAPRVPSTDLSGPSPIRKVDPKYPPTLINEHVEGEVILYAVIRRDGSVDSIQLVRGIDEELDANAMKALSQWKFRPATRQGEPVELEAIVHIPFHAPEVR